VKSNTGFSTITSVCQVLNGDDVDPAEDIAPEEIPFLKYSPMTSCAVERSFSAHKQILSDKKQPRPPENMGNILIVYCALKSQ
jgi:hypothetical protein